jgi:hypothetical protein
LVVVVMKVIRMGRDKMRRKDRSSVVFILWSGTANGRTQTIVDAAVALQEHGVSDDWFPGGGGASNQALTLSTMSGQGTHLLTQSS